MKYDKARPDDLEPLGSLLATSFGFPDEDAAAWFEMAGIENIRVMRGDDGLAGGLLFIPMGQWFGGRSVDMMGVAGVGVAPGARGSGLATRMMHKAVAELRRRRVALSTLYPASVALYRRAGYEIAGASWRMSISCKALRPGERPLTVRSYAPDDEEQVRAVYADYARTRNGWVDRGEYVWHRTRRRWEEAETRGHVFEGPERIDAYVFYRQKRTPMGFELRIADMAARTPAAMRSVMTFLADHRSLAEDVVWFGGADDPWLFLLPEHRYAVRLHHHWMLRVVDVASALATRGYPSGVSAELHLAVSDEVLRGGSYRLRIADGTAEVKEGGRGSLALDVRALAALYSGHLDALALARLGRLTGPAKQIDAARAVFCGPAAAMPDFF